MLSVTSATVHQTMCPNTQQPSTSPTRLVRKDRLWSKFNLFSNKNMYKKNNQKIDVPNQLKNVSINVNATTSTTSEKELPDQEAISITVTEDTTTINKTQEKIASNNNLNNKHFRICEDDDTTLSSVVLNENSDQDEDISPTKGGPERKRKRGVQSRMASAAKLLKISHSECTISLPKTNPPDSISDISNTDISNDILPPIQNKEVNIWDAKDSEDNWEEIWHTDNDIYRNTPYYMTGLPNPPGENLCWLNATLHALFILPLIDYLDRIDTYKSSRLTKTFIAIQHYWKKGSAEKDTIYQNVKRFKEELAILDETYSSQKQQDVSEFLMRFLNHIRNECEQSAVAKKSTGYKINETDSVSENDQHIINVSHVQLTPKKRLPLAPISPLKQINNSNETKEKCMNISTLKQVDSDATTTKTVAINNPIDQFFLLDMLEHYICKGCSDHRQKKIDNLMLYVDIPNKIGEAVDLTEAISKSIEAEERCLICSKCKHAKHNVSTSFRTTPSVLIVQLNRYGMTDGIVEKVNTAVKIPEELSLNCSRDGKIDQFKPVSMIAHVGSAMDCGHYTSYAVHEDQWLHYNDMEVSPMSKEEAFETAQTTAYLVFFLNTKLYPKSCDVSYLEANPLR